MATLQNRGNGSWQVTIAGGYGPNGKQKRLTRTIKVDPKKSLLAQEREVKKQASRLETDYDRHLITESKKVRVSQVAEEYLANRQLADRTRTGYRELLDRMIIPELGHAYIQDLTPRDIIDFYQKLEKAKSQNSRSKNGKLSGTYRRHYHQVLSAILNYSVKAGYISISPMNAVDPPRMDTPEAAFLETTDIARVINAIDHLQDPMYKAFFQLELCTSCRPGELIGLDWADIDGDVLTIRAGSNYIKGVGTVRTDRPKTKASNREIILSNEVVNLLNKWKAAQAEDKENAGDAWPDHDAVFTNKYGQRLYLNNVTKKWHKVQENYGLKKVPLYSLRHTGASLLIDQGCNIEEVSRHLGHSRTSTTLDVYTHQFKKASQHTANAMKKALDAAKKKALEEAKKKKLEEAKKKNADTK